MQYAPPVLAAQPANGRNCGIDWAREDHAIAIVDSDGRAVRFCRLSQMLTGCSATHSETDIQGLTCAAGCSVRTR
jgi:hypothetical protein